MANNRELSQFGSLVEVSNEATSIKVGLADANVGLGTTNPTERLEVHGNIKVVGGSINVGSAGTFTEQTTFSAGVGIADSIFHIGDTNTQVRFPAEDIVSVETGGSERLRVESGGGIGIGDSIYHLGDTNTQVRFPAADTFTVETAGSERFRVGSNGYVSVGKGAQGDELLHVGSASSLSPAIKVENDQGSLIIGRRQSNRFGIGTEGHVIQSVGDDFAIGTSDSEDFTIGTNNEKRITVKSNGRVGVGTDDPDELLEVLGKAKVIDLVASNLSVSSGVGTFQTLKVTGDLTVEGTTTTLDTNLIGVDRVEVGANSNSIVAIAVTQSGKADILNFFNGAGTEVLGITTDGNITIQNADAGSSAAPELTLLRTSASPANADYLGQIKFVGINSSGAQKNYAKITGKILDTGSSNGTEDGIIEFAHIKAGTQTITGRWRSDSLQLLNGTTLTVAGNITANGNIQGDGSTNISSINDITAGGDLTIDGVSDLDELTVAGVSTFSGNIFVGAAATVGFGTHVSFSDAAKAVFGAGQDLQIYHNGTDSIIADTGTGNLNILGDADIAIINAAGDEYKARFTSDGAAELYYDGSKKLETTGLGVTVSGNLGVRTDLSVYGATEFIGAAATVGFGTHVSFSDGAKAQFGTGDDLEIYHDGTNSYVSDTGTGGLKITGSDVYIRNVSDQDMIHASSGSFVKLYHNNSEKLATTGLGVTVYGNLGVRTDLSVYGALDVDGVSDLDELVVAGVSTFSGNIFVGAAATVGFGTHVFFRDTAKAVFGAGQDLQIYHDGSHSYIKNEGSGNLYIDGDTDDLVLQAGDDVRIQTQGNENAINCVGNGAVEIYYNNSKKLETTSAGIIVSGISTLNGKVFVRASSDPTIQIENTDGSISADQSIGSLEFKANDGSNNGSQVTGSIESIAQAAFTGQGSPSHLIFKTNGVSGADALEERLRITHAGNVGIGTDNPAGGSLLHVHGGDASTKNHLRLSADRGLIARLGDTSGSAQSLFDLYDTDGSTQILRFISGGGDNWINTGGNLGIGTVSPEYKTTIAAGSGNAKLNLKRLNTASNGNAFGSIFFTNMSGTDVASVRAHRESAADDAYLGFATRNTGGSISERLRITSGGNVGINSNSPTSYGNSQATLVVSDTTNPALCINDGGQSKDWWIVGQGDGLTVRYADGGGSGSASNVTSAAFFRNNGKTGFGENTPLVTLHVGGTDAIRVPSGTSAQRPTGAVGYIRYNSDIGSYEGHNGSEWAGIGGAAEVETSVSSTAATTCESFAKATYRSATIVAQITQGSSYQVGNYLLIHDGTTATLVEESAVATGDMLGSFTATISGSNVVFQVNMASATAATVTTKMTKVSIP